MLVLSASLVSLKANENNNSNLDVESQLQEQAEKTFSNARCNLVITYFKKNNDEKVERTMRVAARTKKDCAKEAERLQANKIMPNEYVRKTVAFDWENKKTK